MTNAIGLMEEAKWEVEGTRRAAERYQEAAAAADQATLPSGQWLLKQIVPPLIAEITKLQLQAADQIAKASGRAPKWSWPIQTLPAKQLAVITATVGLTAMRGDSGLPTVARQMVQTIHAEMEYRKWVSSQVEANKAAKEAQDWTHEDVLGRFKRRYPDVHRNVWMRWRRKLTDAQQARWDQQTQVSLGSTLIGALCAAAPDHFSIVHQLEGQREVAHLQLSADTHERLTDIETRAEVGRPLLMPMLIPPLDWRYETLHLQTDSIDQKHPPTNKLVGGYLIHHVDGIRSGRLAHTNALDQPVSAADLAAMNAVQSTPWRINQWILDVMLKAWTTGARLGGLEVGEPLSLPSRISDDTWAALSEEERVARKAKRREIHRLNASIEGRSQLVLDALSVSTELRDRPAIYYPHSRDFRHRIYCAATRGPNPQGSDIAKSLIMFAEGKPLGDTGEFWLRVHTANCAGKDKLTLEERVQWTFDNAETIQSYASAPLTFTGWTDADSPWQLLAASWELTQCWSLSEPSSFVSHLPIALDGSCNGIQHLAAMGLDPIGSKATNLTPDPVRQDIYEQVATKVRLEVAQDELDGVPAAAMWSSEGAITRKTVKRAVMTTPYGVTERGIRDQLLLDGQVPTLTILSGNASIGAGQAADYLKDKIVTALDGTVQSARAIMSWLQQTADRLARAGVTFDWTTPSGSRVREAYRHTTVERIETLVGKLSLQLENPKSGLNPRKQSAGSAPNYIHSFDAAHLSLTVNEAVENGITNFAMIHDSYGTHACDTTLLGVVLRRSFIRIYRENWLEKLKAEIATYAPHVRVEEPPVRGTFDIEQVADADYFFS